MIRKLIFAVGLMALCSSNVFADSIFVETGDANIDNYVGVNGFAQHCSFRVTKISNDLYLKKNEISGDVLLSKIQVYVNDLSFKVTVNVKPAGLKKVCPIMKQRAKQMGLKIFDIDPRRYVETLNNVPPMAAQFIGANNFCEFKLTEKGNNFLMDIMSRDDEKEIFKKASEVEDTNTAIGDDFCIKDYAGQIQNWVKDGLIFER